MSKKQGPKILFIDIETKPLTVFAWGLFDQNIGLNQIKEDWAILSWAAKWSDEKKIMYMDVRNNKDLNDEKNILIKLRNLLDEADIVVGHNVAKFDSKKIKARCAILDIPPPSSYKQIDTLKIARKHLALTSNKLEYIAQAFKCSVKKLKSKKFIGFDMWAECMKRNKDAFKEMEAYNKRDVEVLEEVYYKLAKWEPDINFAIYCDIPPDSNFVCACGNTEVHENGYAYGKHGKKKRYKCSKCGKEVTARKHHYITNDINEKPKKSK